MARVLVILPTSSYQVSEYVAAAAELDVELAIASDEEPPLRRQDRFVKIDCAEVEASSQSIADLAATTPIDAIVAGDDAGVVIAARSAELVGLPHNPPAAAEATRDKGTMRRRLQQAEVPQPRFSEVTGVHEALAAAETIGFPVVVKPVGLSAGRGVIRADGPAAVRAAVDRIGATFPDEIERSGGRILVERFVPGREVTLEGLVWEGDLEVLAILDKPDQPDGPYFEETMFVAPTDLPPPSVDDVVRVTRAAVAGLGLDHGPVHAELRIDGTRPTVIEIAARTIGGLCGRALTFGLLGSSLESLVLRQSLGWRRRGLSRTPGATGAYMIPIPHAGTLTSISGLEEARAEPGIWALEISTPVGAPVAPPPDGDRYLGFIFARGRERADVVSALRRSADHVRVEIT